MSDTGDVKKGFKVTIGVMFALFVVFVVLPLGTCIGCTMCAGASAGLQQAEERRELKELGPEIDISDITFKINNSNPYISKASYKFTVKNNRKRNVVKSFDVKFQDADGLEVDSDIIFGETINGGESKTLTGTSTMQPEEGANVASVLVQER